MTRFQKLCVGTIIFLLLSAVSPEIFAQQTQKNDSACAEKDYDCRIAEITDLINQNPNNPEHYLERGYAYLNKKDLFTAFGDFNKAIELNPKYADAYAGRGEVYFRQNVRKNALEDADKAIRLNADSVGAYSLRGRIYLSNANYPKALDNFTSAIIRGARTPEYYYSRGYVLYFMKKYEQAITDFSRAGNIDANYMDGYVGLGICYFELGNFEEMNKAFDIVIAGFTKKIEDEPTKYSNYIQRGLAYSYKNDDRSEKDYNTAMSINPDDPEAYKYLGLYESRKENYERAIYYFSRAIELDPLYAELYRYRGITYITMKDKVNSDLDYKKYMQLSNEP